MNYYDRLCGTNIVYDQRENKLRKSYMHFNRNSKLFSLRFDNLYVYQLQARLVYLTQSLCLLYYGRRLRNQKFPLWK